VRTPPCRCRCPRLDSVRRWSTRLMPVSPSILSLMRPNATTDRHGSLRAVEGFAWHRSCTDYG
jgi:hypothetical protein